jgi:hypothetical protein
VTVGFVKSGKTSTGNSVVFFTPSTNTTIANAMMSARCDKENLIK